MATITTTSDYLTWFVNLDLHTEDEAKTYIESLDFNTPDSVRVISIQAIDRVITVNGIPFMAPIFQEGPTRFSQAFGTYSSINNNRVRAIHYYTDRDYVMVEYLSHPADVRPKNTYHTCADFGSLFQTLFTAWQTSLSEAYAGTLLRVGEVAQPTVVPTGN